MSVSKDDVERIADLARLRPDEAQMERLTDELNGILDHIRALEDLDLSELEAGGVAPPADAARGLRDPQLPPDPLADNAPASIAPDWREGFFVVPRLPALDQGDEGAGT